MKSIVVRHTGIAWGYFCHDLKQWLNTALYVWKSKKLNDFHETLLLSWCQQHLHHPCLNGGASQHCSLELIAILPQLLTTGILTELSQEFSPFPFCPHCPHCPPCLSFTGTAPAQGLPEGKAGAMLQFMGLSTRRGTDLWSSSLLGHFPGWKVRCDDLVPSPQVPFQENGPL